MHEDTDVGDEKNRNRNADADQYEEESVVVLVLAIEEALKTNRRALNRNCIMSIHGCMHANMYGCTLPRTCNV